LLVRSPHFLVQLSSQPALGVALLLLLLLLLLL
jgi:hypothetical protein